jgi:hypothetical protein
MMKGYNVHFLEYMTIVMDIEVMCNSFEGQHETFWISN